VFEKRSNTNVSSAIESPKAPRWINTEAGQLAWRDHPSWRNSALNALSVQERMRLLDEAERLRRPTPSATCYTNEQE
jgi:hypothetical protein